MDNKNKNSNSKNICCKFTSHNIFTAYFLGFMILFFVYVFGIAMGAKLSMYYAGFNPKKILNLSKNKISELSDFSCPMKKLNSNITSEPKMFFNNFENYINEDNILENNTTRIFGIISNIEGNKITVTDNSGGSQIILSQSDTIISTSAGEVGLSILKPGLNIIILGSTNIDNNIIAKIIKIL